MKTVLPYSRQVISEEDIAAVATVLRSPLLTSGPEVELFEQELAAYLGAKHVVAVSSGTAALHLALLAHGIRPGDEVIVPALTFVATANAVLMSGGIPVFQDVEPDTLMVAIDPSIWGISVDYAGQPDGSARIIDAAHSLGAKRDWSRGTYTLSFHPVKAITTGEGGAIATDDAALAERCRLLRSHGRRDGEMVALGFNYRMSDIAAALGRSQLRRADEMVARRRALAKAYLHALRGFFEAGEISVPAIDAERSAWHLMPVLFRDRECRERARTVLAQAGIETAVHYPPVHLQPYYRERFGYREGMFPVAEDAASRILSLPLHPGMDEGDVGTVVGTIKGALAKQAAA
jgi:perosamine synthetase